MSDRSGVSDSKAVDPGRGFVPRFVPHPWIPGPHAQTIVARLLGWPTPRLASTYAEVDVADGERVSVLDSIPVSWDAGDPVAILVHGLSGCARSPYVVRVGRKLVAAGARVVRMNLRGAGSGFGSSRSYYHSGLTEDLRAVAGRMNRLSPDSPIGLVGFSLGANLALKLAAESADRPVPGLDCVVVANPPLDLEACCRTISRAAHQIYDRNFLRDLLSDVARLHRAYPDLPRTDLSKVGNLFDFDDTYTAPLNGFRDAGDYYARSSAGPLVSRIGVPGLVIHAEDDPFIPVESIRRFPFPGNLALELILQGGHLGYFSRDPWLDDRRWLDSRVLAWLADRWNLDDHRDEIRNRRETPFANAP